MAYTNESGRSMVEMLAVLGIIGIISVGGIGAIAFVMTGGQAYRIQSEVEAAAQDVQEFCAWDKSLTECEPEASDLGLSGDVGISDDYKSIIYKNVPSVICRRLSNPALTTWSKNLIDVEGISPERDDCGVQVEKDMAFPVIF